jgi:poly-gamma-glutamate capsule biosynthesis protein CapA/YwtB (metallophosphatase superfamily)
MKHVFLRGALATALLLLASCSRPSADFTLTLGGDIMLSRAGKPIFTNQTGNINPWSELQKQGVLVGQDSDIPDFFFANLESPLGEINSVLTDMNLCSDPEQVSVLTEGGVDLVSLANNHRDDCAANGEAETKTILDQHSIKSAVMGEAATYLDTPNGKMAVIAAEDVTGSMDVTSLLSSIKNAREKAKIVVVAMHWGNEYQAGVDKRQQALAQQIADAGADVIWGHHPHVLQKMEWIKSADGRQVLVLYSLGNLLADQWMLEDAQRSALVRLSFGDSRINGIEIIPLVMDRNSKSLQLAPTAESREDIIDRLGVDGLSADNVKIQIISVTK